MALRVRERAPMMLLCVCVELLADIGAAVVSCGALHLE